MAKFKEENIPTPTVETSETNLNKSNLPEEEIARIKSIQGEFELPGMTLKFGKSGTIEPNGRDILKAVDYDASIKISRGSKPPTKFTATSLLALGDAIMNNPKLNAALKERAKLDMV